MKKFNIALTKIAVLSLGFVTPASAAQSTPIAPETLAATREAVTNMQIIPLIIAGGKAGFTTKQADKKLTKAEKQKLPAIFEAEVNSASARIIDRLTQAEAKKFTPEQITDILSVTRGVYFQSILASTVNGTPTPPESDASASEIEIFKRIGNADYFVTFQKDVMSDGGNFERDMGALLKRAMAKVRK
jgi:hypothetical protein